MANDRSEPTTSKTKEADLVGVISATGAILVVGLGLVFVFVIALVSLGTIPDSQSTVVDLGIHRRRHSGRHILRVRAGSAGKERAEVARDLESMKVQELAARAEPAVAQEALDKAAQRSEEARTASSPRSRPLRAAVSAGVSGPRPDMRWSDVRIPPTAGLAAHASHPSRSASR